MILPLPRAIIDGATCLETMNAPVRFVSTTSRDTIRSISRMGARRWTPALLMRTSICPNFTCVATSFPSTCSGPKTSKSTVCSRPDASGCAAKICSRASLRLRDCRPLSMTTAPSKQKRFRDCPPDASRRSCNQNGLVFESNRHRTPPTNASARASWISAKASSPAFVGSLRLMAAARSRWRPMEGAVASEKTGMPPP